MAPVSYWHSCAPSRATSIVFNVSMRVPGEKRYGPLTEVGD